MLLPVLWRVASTWAAAVRGEEGEGDEEEAVWEDGGVGVEGQLSDVSCTVQGDGGVRGRWREEGEGRRRAWLAESTRLSTWPLGRLESRRACRSISKLALRRRDSACG